MLRQPFPRFGALLHQYRVLRGMTVEQLAEATQLAPSSIRSLEETGAFAPPKATVKRLADALQLSTEEQHLFDLTATLSSPFVAAATQPAPEPAAPPVLAASILV